MTRSKDRNAGHGKVGAMTVATLRLELLVGNCTSVREKRRRMRLIVGKLHRHFNISVADDDRTDDPTRAELLIAAV
ncbi:DUF503 family protein, partial [Singulisphaera rosea]